MPSMFLTIALLEIVLSDIPTSVMLAVIETDVIVSPTASPSLVNVGEDKDIPSYSFFASPDLIIRGRGKITNCSEE